MPDIDTSPAALRALADKLREWDRCYPGNCNVDMLASYAEDALRAIAAEKEAATKSHDPNRAGIAQATAMARNDIRRAFDRDEITAEDYRRMNDELDKSAGIVRAAPKPPMSAAEKEASDRVPGCEAPARVLAEWLGYAWDGLHDRDISNRYPDWVYDDIGGKKFQGGRPALRRVAQAMLAAATGKPDLTVGAVVAFDAASRDAHLEIVREKDATIDALRASLAEAERERDEADAGAEAIEAKFATLCRVGRDCGCSYDAKDHVCMYHSPQLVAAVERAEKAEAERDAAKDEAANFIFDVLQEACGNPSYNPCDGTETWEGDVAGTVYAILNASGLRNEDTGELAIARAEKAESERDAAWRTGYKACVDTVLSYRAHYDWGPKATAQDGAEIAMQAIKDCVVRSAERAGVVAPANPEGPAHA